MVASHFPNKPNFLLGKIPLRLGCMAFWVTDFEALFIIVQNADKMTIWVCSVFMVPRLRRERIRKYVSVLYFTIPRLPVFYKCSNIIRYRGNTQYNVHSF